MLLQMNVENQQLGSWGVLLLVPTLNSLKTVLLVQLGELMCL